LSALPDLYCVPYQQLERLRIRIDAELEERREAGERSHESAVEVLESYAATSARAARGTVRICIGSTIATASAIASTSLLRRRVL
jgi:hypothetical protein